MRFDVRAAAISDAESVVAFFRALANEPGIDVPWGPGEFQMTVEQQARMIEDFARSPNSLLLVAQCSDELIGVLDCKGGRLDAYRHVCSLGLSVRREYRGRGVGHLLMEQAMTLARSTPLIKRMELTVFATNHVAIRLYERFGFTEEGVKQRAVKKEGRYLDLLMMAALL